VRPSTAFTIEVSSTTKQIALQRQHRALRLNPKAAGSNSSNVDVLASSPRVSPIRLAARPVGKLQSRMRSIHLAAMNARIALIKVGLVLATPLAVIR